jgi:hypothetical protein
MWPGTVKAVPQAASLGGLAESQDWYARLRLSHAPPLRRAEQGTGS